MEKRFSPRESGGAMRDVDDAILNRQEQIARQSAVLAERRRALVEEIRAIDAQLERLSRCASAIEMAMNDK